MAEATQSDSLNAIYYCYRCNQEVTPFSLTELNCPICTSGFLEEISNGMSNPYSYPDEEEEESDLEDVSNPSFLPDPMDTFFNRVLMDVARDSPPGGNIQAPPGLGGLFRADALSDVMRHINMRNGINSEEEGENPPHVSFRYFGDYSGDEELDALASRLLDEAEISAPPPLSKDQIKLLPYLEVTSDIVEKGMQCTVCMDNFRIPEIATVLPCNHLYHEKCIAPWFERRATCPNCREFIQVPLKSKRSRSCPRTRLNSRTGGNRRFSEASSINDFYARSMNPFRFYN